MGTYITVPVWKRPVNAPEKLLFRYVIVVSLIAFKNDFNAIYHCVIVTVPIKVGIHKNSPFCLSLLRIATGYFLQQCFLL